MPRKKAALAKKDRLGDVLRLQHHVVARTSNYFQRLGDLASQGSIEPREYIKESFSLLSGVLEEVADWWKPKSELDPRRHLLPVSNIKYQMRPERGDFRFEVPVEVFDEHGEKAEIFLSTDGLVRTFDPKHPLRPALTLAPEQNVRVEPAKVTRNQRRSAELKVFGVRSIVTATETYEGVVWGRTKAAPKRFPVALIELTIV